MATVVLPWVFADLNSAVPASYLDDNFNALVGAISTSAQPVAGSGITVTNGNTVSFNPVSTALDGATFGGQSLGNAFLELFNVGTQTVEGTVQYRGFLQANSGLDTSRTVVWSGNNNAGNNNPAEAGISGIQNFSGTIQGGTITYGGTPLNYVSIAENLSAAITNGVVGFSISQASTGTAVAGARTALVSNLFVYGPTANVGPAGQYCGFQAYCFCNGNDNGTSGATSGVGYGINTVVQLASNCTYWLGCVGYEMDINVAAGASVDVVYGLHVCTTAGHAVNGTQDDIAIHISGAGANQSAYWKVGLGLGANIKNTAFGPSSTFIKAFPDVSTGTLTVATGIDLTHGGSVTITGNAWISQGFTVSGTGTVTCAGINTVVGTTCGTIAAAGTSQATAATLTNQSNVVIGGSGTCVALSFMSVGALTEIVNTATAETLLYPQVGAAIGTLAVNAPYTIGAGLVAHVRSYSSTQWWPV